MGNKAMDPASAILIASMVLEGSQMLSRHLSGEEITDEQLNAFQDRYTKSAQSFRDALAARKAEEPS